MKLPVCISMRQMQQRMRQQLHLEMRNAGKIPDAPTPPQTGSAERRHATASSTEKR